MKSNNSQNNDKNTSLAKKKLDKFVTIAMHITCIYGLYNGISLVSDNVESAIKSSAIEKERFNQNIFGAPYIMDSNGKPIDVVISENFTDEQKNIIANSISNLDDQLVGLDYNITLDNTKTSKNCITIDTNIDHNNKDEDECYGVTYAKYPVFGTKIIYPVEIKLNLDEINNDYKGTLAKIKTYDEFLGTIVKHEMLHTLGLKDLYDYAENGKSIMFGYVSAISPNDPSQEELKVLNSVYPNRYQNILSAKIDINYATTTVGTPEVYYAKDKESFKKLQKPTDQSIEIEREM